MPLVLALLVCVTLVASPALAAPPSETREGGPRIRMTDSVLSRLLLNGTMRSPTLKAIVDRLEAGNVIVYMSLSPIMRSNLAGKIAWMSQAGGYRYLRAQISTDLNPDLMIATMAHELQHALEVSQDPTVTDQRSLSQLYKRIGHQVRSTVIAEWETLAAQEAGLQVRKELTAMTTVFSRAHGTDRL